ncbi:MAG: asparagine--tRNA ligase, partial [Alistipes sp.]|nr:asparagine--tRNA ligase [Alistipes sp.]
MKTQRIVEILKSGVVDSDLTVQGWVRTKRGNKNVAFIALNDGSCAANIQIVVDLAKIPEETLKTVTTGACLRVDGRLVASPASGQRVEVQAAAIEVYGTADPETYPLQKKGHSLEFLRDIAYLRPRTNTFGAVLRIRHAMAYAIHEYFNKNGFYYFHTPIITASDCEGAGAMFQVTTLDMNQPLRTEDGAID